jgi:hypothetical protein
MAIIAALRYPASLPPGYCCREYSAEVIRSMVDASDLEYRIFKFCRTTGTLISETVILEPGGKIAGYSHPNERSWAVEDGNLVFKNGNGAITTVFDKWQLGDGYKFLGRFLPGGDEHFHLLVEVAKTGPPLSSERPVRLKCAGFDELIRAGAEYYPPSRDTEPTINAAFGTIDDTSNDFVVLEDAVLTPNCGIAWNALIVIRLIGIVNARLRCFVKTRCR